jgi:tetratricopeptide (TPR) repeat protein
MTKPESTTASSQVAWLLKWADAIVHTRSWGEADAVFQRAVALDVSPCSGIAYGCALAEQERFNEALCQLTAALDIARRSGDRNALATIYHNLAAIYRELGDNVLARRFQQSAISQLDNCGPAELLGLANDAWLAERLELAECLAGTAADIDEADAYREPSAEVEATIGLLTGFLNDPRDGIRPLLRAYSRHKAAGELRLMGNDLLNLSALLGELGRHRGELACVRRAIACFDDAPAPVSGAKALRLLEYLERLRHLRQFDPSRN